MKKRLISTNNESINNKIKELMKQKCEKMDKNVFIDKKCNINESPSKVIFDKMFNKSSIYLSNIKNSLSKKNENKNLLSNSKNENNYSSFKNFNSSNLNLNVYSDSFNLNLNEKNKENDIPLISNLISAKSNYYFFNEYEENKNKEENNSLIIIDQINDKKKEINYPSKFTTENIFDNIQKEEKKCSPEKKQESIMNCNFVLNSNFNEEINLNYSNSLILLKDELNEKKEEVKSFKKINENELKDENIYNKETNKINEKEIIYINNREKIREIKISKFSKNNKIIEKKIIDPTRKIIIITKKY
jgi:hypothetical protein